MIEVPPDLRERFEAWDAKGRPPQPAFGWDRQRWVRTLPDQPMLATLADPIDRAVVTGYFEDIDTKQDALDAFLATYVWGWANAGYNASRAARILRLNTGDGRDFAADLLELAGIAQAEGGVAAYRWATVRREADPQFFAQWNAAFGTKFISFATIAANRHGTVPITTIMDKIVKNWFARHAPQIRRLNPSWLAPASYERYTTAIADWAEQLGIRPDEVEQSIFVDYRV
ncbi:hypothetical protein V6N00_12455 [Tersicoccus sp. MR15.9]|uniref:8-oxoguanine DNA glycosylase OGG fold protein n=1 Tax=Tersicoccus mangrovi TaxID=3121635 RepID=UPI002FE5942F